MKGKIRSAFTAILFFIPVFIIPQAGGADIPKPSKIFLPRYVEDYSVLKNRERDNLYLNLKYIPLGESGYLSIGGEVRYRYEYFENYLLGKAEQDVNGYLLDRYMFHTDLHLNENIRIFAQLVSIGAFDKTNPFRGLDRNRLDVNQIFIDYRNKKGLDFNLRLGRQELFLGANRLFDYREGPNGRLSFTGARLDIYTGAQITLFLLFPNKINTGYFDDAPETSKKIIGVYMQSGKILENCIVDLYALYNEFPASSFINDGKRITIGIRNVWTKDRLKIDAEAALQIANFNDAGNSAYMIGLDLNYKVIPENDYLNTGFQFLITSGAGTGSQSTFNSLYPSGANFKSVDLFGKYNLTYFQPFIQIKPFINDKLLADAIFYFRSSENDNVYYLPTVLFAKASAISGSYLGVQTSLMYTNYWNDLLLTEIGCRIFWTGKTLTDIGLSDKIVFISAGITFRF